jgi:hypothetical protein
MKHREKRHVSVPNREDKSSSQAKPNAIKPSITKSNKSNNS